VAGTATHASGILASGRKLTFRLTQPVADFVENAASSLCVLPAGHPIEPGGVTPPVPSPAPYYVSEYVPGQRIVLKRNVYYRGPRPHHVDGFVFDLTVDDTQAIDDVINGAADYAFVPNLIFSARAPDLARRFGVNKKQFFVKPSTFLRMFVLNTSRPLFRNNAPLRRAINFALDRAALVRQFGSYAETPVDHYIPPIIPGYRNTHIYPLRKPNLAKARALARGHTRSGKLVLYVNTRPPVLAQAQIVKQDLKKIGLDVESFQLAIRAVLRQNPDVILVGEMRDYETIETALLASETGHLVFSTLHTLDATETINRIIAVFPPHQQKQIRMQLAAVLKAVISQLLIPRADGKGRAAAVEVMITTPFIRDCIVDKEKTHLIHSAIAAGTSQYGMQTFDQAIFALYEQKAITYDEALRWASNKDEFKLKVQGISTTSDDTRDQMAKTVTGQKRPTPPTTAGPSTVTRFSR